MMCYYLNVQFQGQRFKVSCQKIGQNPAENVIRMRPMIIKFRHAMVLFLIAPNSTLQ